MAGKNVTKDAKADSKIAQEDPKAALANMRLDDRAADVAERTCSHPGVLAAKVEMKKAADEGVKPAAERSVGKIAQGDVLEQLELFQENHKLQLKVQALEDEKIAFKQEQQKKDDLIRALKAERDNLKAQNTSLKRKVPVNRQDP